jgi:hypothetical protein
MFRSRFLMAAFVAAIAALAGPATSQAAFSITFTVGANSTSITDQGSGDYATGPSGLNTIDTGHMNTAGQTLLGLTPFSFQGFEIAVQTALVSNPSQVNIDTQTNFIIKYNGSDPSQTIKIEVAATGLTNPGAAGAAMELDHSVTGLAFLQDDGTTGGTGSLNTHALATGGNSSATLFLSSGTAATGANAPPVYFYRPATYDLIQTINVTLNTSNSVQFDTITSVQAAPPNITLVPAPAGLILAATGLPFFGLLRRRLRRAGSTIAA